MDETLARRLADSESLTTIRHLLPKLERRITWRDRPIVLLGTRGELPLARRDDPKKPIVQRVPPGMIDAGHHLGLTGGETVMIRGRRFVVRNSYPEKGSRADITIWMDLTEAQEVLDMPGQITEILAVDCRCAWADIDAVRTELEKILPRMQVILTRDTAVVRAEARIIAETERTAALEQQRQDRDRLKAHRAAFAARVAPMVAVGCAVWVGLLAFANARDRAGEIGILRAIGVRTGRILHLLFARAALMGLVGAAAGYVGGFAVAVALAETDGARFTLAAELFSLPACAAVLAIAPLVAILAGWAPALAAAREDPAIVLSRES